MAARLRPPGRFKVRMSYVGPAALERGNVSSSVLRHSASFVLGGVSRVRALTVASRKSDRFDADFFTAYGRAARPSAQTSPACALALQFLARPSSHEPARPNHDPSEFDPPRGPCKRKARLPGSLRSPQIFREMADPLVLQFWIATADAWGGDRDIAPIIASLLSQSRRGSAAHL